MKSYSRYLLPIFMISCFSSQTTTASEHNKTWFTLSSTSVSNQKISPAFRRRDKSPLPRQLIQIPRNALEAEQMGIIRDGGILPAQQEQINGLSTTPGNIARKSRVPTQVLNIPEPSPPQ